MARINGSVSRNSDSYSFYIDWSETIPSDYISTNKTTVTATAYIYCSAHTAWASNLLQKLIIDGTTFTDTKTVNLSSGVTVTLVSGSKEITHNADGSKSITISADCDLPYGDGWGPDSGTASGTATLTTIPRYATSVQSLNSKTSSSIKMNWSSDSTIDYVWYSKNGGSSWTAVGSVNSTSGNYTISGLSSNTSYSIKTRVRRKDSQLTTDSTALSVSTYAKTIPTISLSSKTVNSITVSSSCNVAVSSTQYRIKTASGSYGGYQTSNTFSNLAPNTSYIIEVKKVGSASGESGTATLSVTTYDIARLTTYSNFNLGDNVTIGYSNPSGSPIEVGIYDTEGRVGYATYRRATGTSYTFELTDEELDSLYKAMTTNSMQVRMYINTNNNQYRDSQVVNVILTGNQKTGHIKINNAWKRSKKWANVNGTWKRCVRWVKVDGAWKRCI